MKLNLHPKEFLALYNLLSIQRSAAAEDPTLQLVYNRMKACIISALSKRSGDDTGDDPFDVWEKNQKKKIDELSVLNERLKTVKGEFLTADEK